MQSFIHEQVNCRTQSSERGEWRVGGGGGGEGLLKEERFSHKKVLKNENVRFYFSPTGNIKEFL